MGRILTAFRAFFGTLFYRETAKRVRDALSIPSLVVDEARPQPESQPVETGPLERRPLQNEAITLLATLQREARLVDFFKEDLSTYSDEQVGAAVREIHRDSKSVLDRFFSIKPIRDDAEEALIELPAGYDAARYRLTGKLSGTPPFQGILRHHGWEATRCELPAFTGNESAAKTIAPAEVEVQ
jgi:Domain of unknown function (DUF2760)